MLNSSELNKLWSAVQGYGIAKLSDEPVFNEVAIVEDNRIIIHSGFKSCSDGVRLLTSLGSMSSEIWFHATDIYRVALIIDETVRGRKSFSFDVLGSLSSKGSSAFKASYDDDYKAAVLNSIDYKCGRAYKNPEAQWNHLVLSCFHGYLSLLGMDGNFRLKSDKVRLNEIGFYYYVQRLVLVDGQELEFGSN